MRCALVKNGPNPELLKEGRWFYLPRALAAAPAGFDPNEIPRDYLRLRAKALADGARFAAGSPWQKRLLLPRSERDGTVAGMGLSGVTWRERLRCYPPALAPDPAPVGLNFQNFRQRAAGPLFLRGYKEAACCLLRDAPRTLWRHDVCWFYGRRPKECLAVLRREIYARPLSAAAQERIWPLARGRPVAGQKAA